MKYAAPTIAFFVCCAFAIGLPAQDAASKGFESIRLGTRIELTLKNGSVFTGEVVELKADRVKLNLSFEKVGVEGYMTFYKREIRKVVFLALVPVDEKAKINAEREEAKKAAATSAAGAGSAVTAGAGASATDGTGTAGTESKEAKEAAEKKKNRDLAQKFPASEWNEARKDEIAAKPASSRTPEEQEFLENYDKVSGARDDEAKEKRAELLKKYLPSDGWGEEKYKKLKDQLVVLGFPPDANEQEFVDNYGDWQKAYQESQEAEAKSKEKSAGATEPAAKTEEGAPPEEGATPPSEETPPTE